MLRDLITGRVNLRIGVIGLGYVGLPLAVEFAEHDVRVIGVDVMPGLIDNLRAGQSIVEGLSGERIQRQISKGTLAFCLVNERSTDNTEEMLQPLLGMDVFIVCVPTPLKSGEGWAPDLKYIRSAEELIRRIAELEEGQKTLPDERLIILESTSYPGTTNEIFFPLVNDFGNGSRKWYLAYSPERTNPGPKAYEKAQVIVEGKERSAFQMTRVVGGLNEASAEHAESLYRTIYNDVRVVRDMTTAEMVKLVENTFRFVAIGFSNEMSRIAKTMGLNVWEIIDAAKTKGFGLDICQPGLIGGHCVPIDPHYLGWWLRNRKQIASFIDAAERAHQDMKHDALDLIQRLLNRSGRGFAGSSILFFGISYKKNIGDIRESAALELIKRLHAANAKVSFWDPVRAKHALKSKPRITFSEDDCRGLSDSVLKSLRRDNKGNGWFYPPEVSGEWTTLRDEILQSGYHCIVLATDHDDFKDSYLDTVLSDDCPPIADLANCIPAWLNELPSLEDQEKVKAKMQQPGKYMLLGVD